MRRHWRSLDHEVGELPLQSVLLDDVESMEVEFLDSLEKPIRTWPVDTALDGVITIDSTGIVTDWNAQATAIFGWSREEALGRALSETIIPERDRQAHDHGIRAHLFSK